MSVYGTEQIRNVVSFGHRGAGKTTVAKASALLTGVTKRMGRMPDGNTISDHDKGEIRRQLSIPTTLTPLEHEGEDGPIGISLLDTPEFFDFVGEVEEAISVADAAIVIVNCKAGIGPGTERTWEMCEKHDLPGLIFITNMNDDHTGYRKLAAKPETKLGREVASFQLLIRKNEKSVGFVNVVKMGGHRFTRLSDYKKCKISDYVQKNLTIARDALIEAVTEASEKYTERYFLGEEFTQEEISTALRIHVIERDIVPVMTGSGINCRDFKVLLQAIDKYFPSPDHLECIDVDVSTGEHLTAKYNDDVSLSARVLGTIVDLFIGKYLPMKICTDTLKGDTVVYNVNRGTEEKIGKLYIPCGKDQIEVQELRAGDIGAVIKPIVTQTGGTMAIHTAPIIYHKPQTSTPYTHMAYKAANKGEDDKVSAALVKIMEEDLTLKMVSDAENRQVLLHGIGDRQLDMVISKLQDRYKADVTLSQLKFAFRETLRKKVKVRGEHKKQSSGHGQYGDVIMEFEPSGDLETPYVLEEKVLGDSVPRNYFPAVEKGLQECVLKGPVVGHPAMGLRATLLNGSYRSVNSSKMIFKMAIILAFKQGFTEANPAFLEPIVSLKVTVSDEFAGSVMGDSNRRRGRVLGTNSNHNGEQVIEADIPMSGLFGYNIDLCSMTGGPGNYSYRFSRYEQASGDVQEREIEARTAAKDDEQK